MVAIQTRTIGDVYILDISGKMILGEGTTHIRHVIGRILRQGGKKIILNLTGVQRIDGSVVAELIRTFTRVAKAGEEPRFLNVTKRLWEFLVITKLLIAFRTYDSEREAVTSFA